MFDVVQCGMGGTGIRLVCFGEFWFWTGAGWRRDQRGKSQWFCCRGITGARICVYGLRADAMLRVWRGRKTSGLPAKLLWAEWFDYRAAALV